MARREIDLIVVVASSLALTAVILALPSEVPARVALGLPFILLFPGYALVAALFPGRDDLTIVERLALSIGLSLAIVPLIALALGYSTWGIRLHPILAFVTLFIALTAAVAVYRRRSLPKEDAFGIRFGARLLRPSRVAVANGAVALTAVVTLAVLGVAAYVLAIPSEGGEAFTEFYVLGSGGQAEGYPGPVVQGGSAPLILGLVNHEGRDTAYEIAAKIDGRAANRIQGLTLGDGDKWERMVSLIPVSEGDSQKVEFLLYRDGASQPYRSLHLWLDVERLRPAFVSEARPSPTPTPTPAPVLAEEESPAEEPTPTPEPQPRIHIVVAGEHLTAISTQYGVPLKDVIAANDLPNPNLIYPQQQILIPAGESE